MSDPWPRDYNRRYDGIRPAEEVSVCVDVDWFGDTQDPRSE